MNNAPTYIDLFAGCGGLSLGLHNAGWKGLFAIEKSKDAFETLEHNLIKKKKHFDWVNWLDAGNHEINQVLETHANDLLALRGKVTLVAGGPPCQGFSLAGLRNEDDLRNSLINSYIKVIELVKPEVLFFENVTGFTISFKPKPGEGVDQAPTEEGTLKEQEEEEEPIAYSEIVLEKLKELGYADVTGKIIDFSEFGVPQSRKRFILIGTLKGNASDFYTLLENNKDAFLKKRGLETKTTLSEAISDLRRTHGDIKSPDTKNFKAGLYGPATTPFQKYLRLKDHKVGIVADSHRFVNHRDNIIKRFKTAIKEKLGPAEYRKRFNLRKVGTKLLDPNDVTPTLTTLPDDYIHYEEPRILTVREYARIQSFPDWFEFKGKYTTGNKNRVKEVPRYTQIGNAIPPLFAEQAGVVLKKLISNE